MMRCCLVSLVVASAVSSQTAVSGGGDALQVAIDAAAPGDTLVVSAGAYTGFDIDKGVTIVCDPGVTLSEFNSAVVRVNAVPAGQTFVLRGPDIVPPHPLTLGVFVFDCAGRAIFESIDTSGLIGFQSCNEIAFHQVSNVGISGTANALSIVDCANVGVNSGGRLSISGGSGTLFLQAPNAFLTGDGSTWSAFITGGTVRVDSGVTFSPAPSLSEGATLIPREIPTVSASPLVPGGTFVASTTIGAGQVGALVLGLPSPVVTSPIGDYWGGSVLLGLASGTAPASGVLSASVPVPSFLLPGEKYVLHGVALDTAGNLSIGPALVTVVP